MAKKVPSKKISTKKTESCYYAGCCKDIRKDIRLCRICVLYVREEYVGHNKKDYDFFHVF